MCSDRWSGGWEGGEGLREAQQACVCTHTHGHPCFSLQKKLPLMALSTTMAESFKELDPDSSMG